MESAFKKSEYSVNGRANGAEEEIIALPEK